MPSLTILEQSPKATQRVLVFGGPKSGKTELVGKLAEHFNLIWFDCEQGWSTLTKMPAEWKQRVRIISLPDSRIYPIAAETWLKVIKGTATKICELHGKVECALCKKSAATFEDVELSTTPANTIVVFDSLTQFTNSCISHITKNQPDDYKLQLDDWGNLRVLIDKFLSQVQAAGYNVVCITHEEEVEMEDGVSKLVPVSGSSKSSRNTAKYFDHVIYCQVKNKKHIASSSTVASLKVLTGSRTNVEIEKDAEQSLLPIFKHLLKSNITTEGVKEDANKTQEPSPAKQADQHGSSSQASASASSSAGAKTASQLALERLRSRSSS